MPVVENTILICAGGACISAGEKSVKETLEEKLQEYSLENVIKVVETGCMGACDLGPIMVIYPEGVFFTRRLSQKMCQKIVEEHLLKGRVVNDLLYKGDKGDLTIKTSGKYSLFYRAGLKSLREI